jgi:arylsulfatase A-like enzyme
LTPELERFAADAVTFEQAITAQSWTLTAYVKLGLVNSPHLNPGVGYGRAFDIYNFDHKRLDERGRQVLRSVEKSHEILERWIGAGIRRPFFLFLHLMDPHGDRGDVPYEAPAPFADRFVPRDLLALRLPRSPGVAVPIVRRIRDGTATLGARERSWVEARYEGGVAYTDHHLGRFLDLLRMRHLYNDALIVVTAIARLPRGAELASSESDREGLRALGYLP